MGGASPQAKFALKKARTMYDMSNWPFEPLYLLIIYLYLTTPKDVLRVFKYLKKKKK